MPEVELYENILPPGTARCRRCGKIIRWGSANGHFAMKSHARAHVRRGEAREKWVQSPTCYQGRDCIFTFNPEDIGPVSPIAPPGV